MLRRIRRLAVPLVVASAALAGCAQSADRAVTVAEAAGATNAPSGQPSSGASDRQLTDVQLRQALLTTADLPDGWTRREASDAIEIEDAQVTPAACQPVFDLIVDDEEFAATRTEEDVEFTRGAARSMSVDHGLSSYADGSQAAKLRAVAGAVATCPQMTVTGHGHDTSMTVTPLDVPPLGDARLAFRAATTAESGTKVVLDGVFVASGRNVLSLISSGVEPLPAADVEQLARTAMAKLDAARR